MPKYPFCTGMVQPLDGTDSLRTLRTVFESLLTNNPPPPSPSYTPPPPPRVTAPLMPHATTAHERAAYIPVACLE